MQRTGLAPLAATTAPKRTVSVGSAAVRRNAIPDPSVKGDQQARVSQPLAQRLQYARQGRADRIAGREPVGKLGVQASQFPMKC